MKMMYTYLILLMDYNLDTLTNNRDWDLQIIQAPEEKQYKTLPMNVKKSIFNGRVSALN